MILGGLEYSVNVPGLFGTFWQCSLVDWNILVMFQGGFEDAGNVLEPLEYSYIVFWWIGIFW